MKILNDLRKLLNDLKIIIDLTYMKISSINVIILLKSTGISPAVFHSYFSYYLDKKLEMFS